MSHNNETCAICTSTDLFPVIDFGRVALAGRFLTEKQLKNEPRYRLQVLFCEKCYAVQVSHIVPPQELFENYFYHSSSILTLREHFRDYAKRVVERFMPAKKGVFVEFGCNDGVLLSPIADEGIDVVVGVDPATNVISKLNDDRVIVINEYFSHQLALELFKRFGPADIISANNVFAHIPDINDVVRGVKFLLAEDGVFIFEVHYLGQIIEEFQYDMIYHEHIFYYSLLSIVELTTKHGIAVFDVELVSTHGGSIRVFCSRSTSKYAAQKSKTLEMMIDQEKKLGFHGTEAFSTFLSNVEQKRSQLMELIRKLKDQGKTIAGYGASGRANTIIQYCGINSAIIDYIVDDSPAKQGFFTPGSHIEIKSREILASRDRPDYVLVFAWAFSEEILNKNKKFRENGGKFILPLPNVKIIG